MSNTGPEGTVPGATPGGGGAGLHPAGADAGEGRDAAFEELEKELQDVVARLERGDVPVDDAIALFRRGEELYRACVARLDAAQLRVEELAGQQDGPQA
jgi:exodeoxyribonuclease VII small subunit